MSTESLSLVRNTTLKLGFAVPSQVNYEIKKSVVSKKTFNPFTLPCPQTQNGPVTLLDPSTQGSLVIPCPRGPPPPPKLSISMFSHVSVCLLDSPETLKRMLSSMNVGASMDLKFSGGLPGSLENNYKWCLKLFPKGIDKSCKGIMSCFLCLESAKSCLPVKVRFGFFIGGKGFEKEFTSGDMWGYRLYKYDEAYASPFSTSIYQQNFSDQGEFSGNLYQNNDIKFGEVWLEVLITQNKKVKPFLPLDLVQSTQCSVASFFSKRDDIILKINDHDYFINKEILFNKSDVFKAMFEHDTLEKQTNVVEVKVNIDDDSMLCILEYLCFHRINDKIVVNWPSILEFANYYNIEEVKDIARYYMSAEVEVENVVEVLILADTYSDKILKDFCLEYIYNYRHTVRKTESWDKLKKVPDLCHEILSLMIDEAPI